MRISGGEFKGRTLFIPENQGATRPTSTKVRQVIFDMVQTTIENARVLDIFAGTGANGFEALSRGASQAHFIDKDQAAVIAMEKSAEKLGVQDRARIWKADALTQLTRLDQPFDIITIDPPYPLYNDLDEDNRTPIDHILTYLDNSPLITPSTLIFVEATPRSSIVTDNYINLQFHKPRKYGGTVLYKITYKGPPL
ncbi:MAG: Ribosomal RNA small subunit methyltransferase D [Chlamydiia bacterium]|nr:Ribosomal RNA small subunit methyltransferase D [Chlamydiia bacterium]